ncbi:MAG: ABC transporter permease, partial [Anaerolineae bacterium]|nr:ABC transporter permease [Anaerolineae bacterium]
VLGNLPPVLRVLAFIFFPLWTAFIIFFVAVIKPPAIVLGIFSLFFFIHLPAIIVTLVLPAWVLGQLLQRFGFLDLKISLRAMVATKGRGASMLLALVIGIFTLSAITMMVDSILNLFDSLLIDQIGGNVLIFPAGGEENLTQVESILENHQGVKSYSVIRNYEVNFLSLTDVSENQVLKWDDIEERILSKEREIVVGDESSTMDMLEFSFNSIDARRLDANLPDVDLYKGRQLDPQQDTGPDADGYWPIVISATQDTIDAGFDVGDLITFSIEGRRTDTITFLIVGMLDKRSGAVSGISSDNYTPIAAFGEREPSEVFGVADVEENQIRSVRRELAEIPGVFVLETRLVNELITSIIDQFTSFPILVAGLALFTGGIVIANAVALSTMER